MKHVIYIIMGYFLVFEPALAHEIPEAKNQDNIIRCYAQASFELNTKGEIIGYKPANTLVDGECGKDITPPADPKPDMALGMENVDAARAHNVLDLRDKYEVDGTGVSIGLWDGGIAQINHREFDDRVTYGEYKYLNDHATHVAGTMAAKGRDETAIGMAPGASVKSFDFHNDIAEMSYHNQFQVTNHSYAVPAGWNLIETPLCDTNWYWGGSDSDLEDYHFGKYDDTANSVDTHIFRNQMISMFIAASNEGDGIVDPSTHVPDPRNPKETWTGRYCMMKNGKMSYSRKARNSDLAKSKYDILTGMGVSKNAIVVGAAEDVEPGFRDTDIRITNFSAIGGTDDSRIKPDVIANGRLLNSTRIPARCNPKEGGNDCPPKAANARERARYGYKNGTSMATPVVTGIGALLNQIATEHSQLKRFLYADEMKVLMTHTARSPTSNGAPDYRYGWGMVDARAAGDLLTQRAPNSLFQRVELKEGDSREEKPITWADASKGLRVSLAWIDEPNDKPVFTTLNDPTPVLVRDIDMRLISPSGMIYYPWTLSMGAIPPSDAVACSHSTVSGSTCARNKVDNIERIDVPRSKYESGQWTIIFDTSNVDLKPWHGDTLTAAFAKSEVDYKP